MKKIADIMNKNLATVDADDSFEEALKLMKEKGIGRVPVLENGKLIGVITRNDILVRLKRLLCRLYWRSGIFSLHCRITKNSEKNMIK